MHHACPSALSKSLDDISAARLSSYKLFFNPANDVALYGTYCWNEAVSSCFMRLIGVLEISLRNRFHTALSTKLWDSTVSAGSLHSNDWYNRIALVGKGWDQIQKATHRKTRRAYVRINPPPLPHKVVASLTYGFWPRLLDITQDIQGRALQWGHMLPMVLPDHHQWSPVYWASQSHQDKLYARLDMVGDLRNRVAHFEPIWKLKELKEEKRLRNSIPVGVEKPAPSTPDEAIERLQLLYKRTSQLLYWLSKERAADFQSSETHSMATYLLTKEALARYQMISPTRNAKLSGVTKSWGMKLMMREPVPLVISDKQKIIGRYYPYSLA